MTLEGSCHCGKARWRFEGPLESVTSCNCTVCRRYGVLWIYGHDGDEIAVTGPTKAYARGGENLEFHFCGDCGCIVAWRARSAGADGRRRIAVNLRLVDDPNLVGSLLIDHFDGLHSFEDLPRDGKTVKDMWF